jgi:hypothetical protein
MINAATRLAEQLPTGKGRRLLEAALARARRKVGKGYRRAVASRTAADLHEWRKRLKEYGHLLAVAGKRLKGERGPLRLAKETEELLGDDHDLAILRERVVRMSASGPKRFAGSVAIGKRRLRLQGKAFVVGRRLIRSAAPKLR